MKRFPPHLIYLALIAAAGLFCGQQLSSDSQWIMLLNRTTDETIRAASHYNGELQENIRKLAKEYPSPKHTELKLLTTKADSLVLTSFSDAALRDSLSSRLWTLTDRDPRLPRDFQTLLPPKKQAGFSQEYQTLLSQNDSIRRCWTLAVMLDHFAAQMGRPCYLGDFIQPAISSAAICPPPGNPFEIEIFLSKFSIPSTLRYLSVNGRLLQYKEGLAHFVQIFPNSGIYPLHVTAEGKFKETDSLIRAEKTFYLHVNH